MNETIKYIDPPIEIFVDEEKPERDLTWQKECAAKLIAYCERNSIKAELVSVMTNGYVSAFVFKSKAFKAIKQCLPDIEYNLGLEGKIRATEKFREYNRGIHFGIETYYRFLEGIYSSPFMRVKEEDFFVTLEIPSSKTKNINFRVAFRMPFYAQTGAQTLAFPIGRPAEGNFEVGFLESMPHLLIGGSGGSGKTIFISTIIAGLICKNSPQDVRFLLIDPKRTELTAFENLPHSLTKKLIFEPKHAINALNYVVNEMERRFKILAAAKEADISSYNASEEVSSGKTKKLPYIVIIIDEFSDLILTHKKEFEKLTCTITQKGRAAGIHMVLSSQRMSADIFTPLIKEYISAKAAFRVSNHVDSRIILGANGAETLIGSGDMLYLGAGEIELKRIQGCYISLKEVENLVKYIIDNTATDFNEEVEKTIFK